MKAYVAKIGPLFYGDGIDQYELLEISRFRGPRSEKFLKKKKFLSNGKENATSGNGEGKAKSDWYGCGPEDRVWMERGGNHHRHVGAGRVVSQAT